MILVGKKSSDHVGSQPEDLDDSVALGGVASYLGVWVVGGGWCCSSSSGGGSGVVRRVAIA